MTDDAAPPAVALDPQGHRRLQGLLGTLAERFGPLPHPPEGGARYAGGSDLVGAALVVAERDPNVFGAIVTEIHRAHLRRAARAELLAICTALEGITERLDPSGTRDRAERLCRELRDVVVAVVVQDEPVDTAQRLAHQTRRLAGLAPEAGPWAQPLQDLAASLDDIHDALVPAVPQRT